MWVGPLLEAWVLYPMLSVKLERKLLGSLYILNAKQGIAVNFGYKARSKFFGARCLSTCANLEKIDTCKQWGLLRG